MEFILYSASRQLGVRLSYDCFDTKAMQEQRTKARASRWKRARHKERRIKRRYYGRTFRPKAGVLLPTCAKDCTLSDHHENARRAELKAGESGEVVLDLNSDLCGVGGKVADNWRVVIGPRIQVLPKCTTGADY